MQYQPTHSWRRIRSPKWRHTTPRLLDVIHCPTIDSRKGSAILDRTPNFSYYTAVFRDFLTSVTLNDSGQSRSHRVCARLGDEFFINGFADKLPILILGYLWRMVFLSDTAVTKIGLTELNGMERHYKHIIIPCISWKTFFGRLTGSHSYDDVQ